jgi:hypothetical protein
MLGHSIVSQYFTEPQGSIPNSQQLSTCSYPEPEQSSPHHPILTPQDLAQYYLPIYVLVLRLGLPTGLLSPRFLTNHLYAFLFSPIRATCLVHLILLDLIILTILDEEYKSRSSSLCSFLHSSGTSSVFRSNIHLSTLFSNTLNI